MEQQEMGQGEMERQETGQPEMDIRVHRFYSNILSKTECQKCDRGRSGGGALSLGEMLEHIERTGHRFHFQTRSVHSLEDQNREGTKTMSPRLDEFLEVAMMYSVVQIKPGEVQPASYNQVLRRHLEQQGFDAAGLDDKDVEERFEIRQVWRCNDGYSHSVELDEKPEGSGCPVCRKDRMDAVERARMKFTAPTPHP